MSVRLLVSVKTKNKWRPALKITQTDKTSLVIRVTLNSTYFERLTWPCSFHGCESRNHKQNLNCSQNWYEVTTNQFSYHLRKPVIVKNKVTAFSLYKLLYDNMPLSFPLCFDLSAFGSQTVFLMCVQWTFPIYNFCALLILLHYFWIFDSSLHQSEVQRRPPTTLRQVSNQVLVLTEPMAFSDPGVWGYNSLGSELCSPYI